MQQEMINAVRLHELFDGGYRNLKKNMTFINDLNVFPVPDGDTGTNMVKTFGGGFRAVEGGDGHVGKYMQSLSKAVLLSARGNSGVIFSQFVHGLARGFADKETICFGDFAFAFAAATEDAYASIIVPTEGTILTLIREASEFLSLHAAEYADFQSGFSAVLHQMKATLAKTPELLPVLKEAGVVDSGGAGLVAFVEGICVHLSGGSVEETPDLEDSLSVSSFVASDFGPDSVLEYGYCTEFILQLMNAKCDLAAFDLATFTKPLEELGDSIVAVANDGIVKIHIHSFTPEKVLAYAREYGEFVTIKIENMSVQHSEVVAAAPKKEHLKYAIVAVASGEGICDYFKEIGANYIIDGGQTNNPSVDSFLEAFDSFDAEHIVVLPNNSNIVLTANQAASMYDKCDIRVIPTKSVVEGYSALSMMDLWSESVDELIENMSAGLESVVTGYVTTAIRDTSMNGVDVKKGQYIGLDRKTILSAADDRLFVAEELVHKVMERESKDVIILFYGAAVSEEEALAFRDKLEEAYPLVDIGLISGKQEIYDYIISLE